MFERCELNSVLVALKLFIASDSTCSNTVFTPMGFGELKRALVEACLLAPSGLNPKVCVRCVAKSDKAWA